MFSGHCFVFFTGMHLPLSIDRSIYVEALATSQANISSEANQSLVSDHCPHQVAQPELASQQTLAACPLQLNSLTVDHIPLHHSPGPDMQFIVWKNMQEEEGLKWVGEGGAQLLPCGHATPACAQYALPGLISPSGRHQSPCRPWSEKIPPGGSLAGFCSPVFREVNETKSYDGAPVSGFLGTFNVHV